MPSMSKTMPWSFIRVEVSPPLPLGLRGAKARLGGIVLVVLMECLMFGTFLEMSRIIMENIALCQKKTS